LFFQIYVYSDILEREKRLYGRSEREDSVFLFRPVRVFLCFLLKIFVFWPIINFW